MQVQGKTKKIEKKEILKICLWISKILSPILRSVCLLLFLFPNFCFKNSWKNGQAAGNFLSGNGETWDTKIDWYTRVQLLFPFPKVLQSWLCNWESCRRKWKCSGSEECQKRGKKYSALVSEQENIHFKPTEPPELRSADSVLRHHHQKLSQ